ncbi:MAG TPA: alpha/beta fold hydrolase [Sphingomicrobium sp.]|nr:alpha/beta fold hydrolase [Sphingomicrobium sp.]
MPRAGATLASLPFAKKHLAGAPKGDGRPVLLLPGFGNSDRSLFVLKRFLIHLGYRAESWQLGRNFGTRTVGGEAEKLFFRIENMAEAAGERVTLVGVSLGGMLARLAAHRLPGKVREVITIASPYAADPRATNVWRIYELISGQRLSSDAARSRMSEIARPLAVPATAIWSPSDGLVNGHACYMPSEPGLRTIEIAGSHMGVQLRPRVMRAVADVLAGANPF